MATIYLAARYSRREELDGYRDQLERIGHQVTSRWLNGNHPISDAGLADEHGDQGFGVAERSRFALEDLEDLTAADTIIAFTEAPRSTSSRGGRHVELGIAIGQGKRVIVVGHRENVFCCLPIVQFHATWFTAWQQLQIERLFDLHWRNAKDMADLAARIERAGEIFTPYNSLYPQHPLQRPGDHVVTVEGRS